MIIKKFESFEVDDYYKKISYQDAYDLSGYNRLSNPSKETLNVLLSNVFSDHEIKMLKKCDPVIEVIKPYSIRIKRNIDRQQSKYPELEYLGGYLVTVYSTISYSIYKITDDYFIVDIHQSTKGLSFVHSEYYKCDQIEGVIKLMEDIKCISL